VSLAQPKAQSIDLEGSTQDSQSAVGSKNVSALIRETREAKNGSMDWFEKAVILASAYMIYPSQICGCWYIQRKAEERRTA
jgi:hypothetical protein